MKLPRPVFAGVLFLAIIGVLGAFLAHSDSSQKTMTRTEDQVVVSGSRIPAMQGWQIAQIRAFALAENRCRAIPFQIDEVKDDGKYALPNGSIRSSEDGIFDANDELVFMVFDSGDRGEKSMLPAGYNQVVELELKDPLDGGRSWLYLARYPQNRPPVSANDYVTFDAERTFVDSPQYSMGFHPVATLSIGHLATKPAAGGNGINQVDRLKIRYHADIRGGLGDLDKNEEQFVSRTIGWIDGPVRVIRSTANQMKLWKFKTPSAYLNNIYYINSFEFPTEVSIPFNPNAVLRNQTFRVSTDTLCGFPGRIFYNSRNNKGVLIDGVMSDGEKQLDHQPYDWSVVMEPNKKSAWINRLVWDRSSPVTPLLYYMDDQEKLDPPEDDPGHCGDIGYTLQNLDQIGRGKLRLVSILYQSSNFKPGKVRTFMNILDHPLQVQSRAM